MHVLNAPPYTGDLIGTIKGVYKSKLAETVSHFIPSHLLLLQRHCYIIIWFLLSLKLPISSGCSPNLIKFTDIYFYWRFNSYRLLRRADWKLLTDVSNNGKRTQFQEDFNNLTLRVKKLRTFKMKVTVYHYIRRNIPNDRYIQQH